MPDLADEWMCHAECVATYGCGQFSFDTETSDCVLAMEATEDLNEVGTGLIVDAGKILGALKECS